MSSSSGPGLVGCGQTSATWLPSTMRLPPSTGPSGSRERRSSAFIRRTRDCLTPTKMQFTRRSKKNKKTKRRIYMSNTIIPPVFYRTLNLEALEIFYREAGPRDAPTVLLLHGFPSSSHMFRNLIPLLADKYHVIAPDFPGYGESSAPPVNDFDYSFERFATVTEKFTEKLNLSSYALYLSDIGASVGFHLAVMHPERVTAMIVQNADAHVEAINKEFLKQGLSDYWEDPSQKNAQVLLDWLLTIEGTKWHYLHGVSDPSKISPDNWVIDQAYQDRPGNK